jgi:hypothetical protein
VKAIVSIDLPRPRLLELKHDPRTVALEREIESLIDSRQSSEQQLAAMGAESA